ncbi:MAG: MBL fold metallo-hydrolase [Gammaproteobacteria bacterium]|nr:MBL fold metallo-hydrolase [Gammaproteobacteria bacterium]
MRLTFLGTGSAFTVGADNFHSNVILEDGNSHRLLIDCGSDVRHSLHQQELSHHDITDVYISHLHSDHVGGLEWLAFKSKFDGNGSQKKPTIHISEQLVDKLWEHVLSGGLHSLREEVSDLSTYFNVNAVGKKNTFTWQSVKFELVQTEHVYNGKKLVPSFGLFFTINNTHCFFTTDTQFKPEKYKSYYEKADIIFHDCETSECESGVHSHYSRLKTLDPAIKAKMWLYHYDNSVLPDAKKDGFLGFVKKGQSFNF